MKGKTEEPKKERSFLASYVVLCRLLRRRLRQSPRRRRKTNKEDFIMSIADSLNKYLHLRVTNMEEMASENFCRTSLGRNLLP